MSGGSHRLQHFLLSAFEADEMRQLIAFDPSLGVIADDLPGAIASKTQLATAIVALVHGQGLYGSLVSAILAARPHRESDITTLAVLDGPRAGNVDVHVGAPTAESARRLAWVTYVQLTTRIASAELPDDHGSLREAMSSLYTLFTLLREALIQAGPESAVPPNEGEASVASLVGLVLNTHLRPFLGCWHPRLQDHEACRADGSGPVEHEIEWESALEVRAELRLLQADLAGVARVLAAVLGIQASSALLSLR